MMRHISYQPGSMIACYADDLASTVRNRFLTKMLFSIIFLAIAFGALIFAAISSWKHTGTQVVASCLTILSFLVAVFISRIPSNRRKLIEPLGINLEINVEDYYWLEHVCKKIPEITPDVQNLLIQNGEINFSDFEKIWIKLGEYSHTKHIEKEISLFIEQSKLIFFTRSSVIKQRILAL